jgi:hypothetical protein
LKVRFGFTSSAILLILISIAAGFLLPLWALAIYLVIVMMLIGALPRLWELVLDPRNSENIRDYFNDLDVTDVTIKPYPNHYGVRFSANGRRYYVRCTVAGGKITWKGESPGQLMKSGDR